MMKKSLLLTILLLNAVFIGTAWGQNPDYDYDFENPVIVDLLPDTELTFKRDGWTMITLNNEGRITTAVTVSGDIFGYFSFLFPRSPWQTQYLISPELTGSGDIRVVFDCYNSNDDNETQYSIAYYTSVINDFNSFDFNSLDWSGAYTLEPNQQGSFDREYKSVERIKYVIIKCLPSSGSLYVDNFKFYGASKVQYFAPQNSRLDNVTTNSAKLSWESGAEKFNVRYKKMSDIEFTQENDVSIEDQDNKCYTFENLDSGCQYVVGVQADYGDNHASDWAEISFTTDCEEYDKCSISYVLNDSNGDGWDGDAAIQVLDYETNMVIATWKLDNDASCNGTLSLCNGTQISFKWIVGDYDDECSFTIYDPIGNEIVSFDDASEINETPFATYTMACPSCPAPKNISVSNITPNSAVVGWTSDASNFYVQYKKTLDDDWEDAIPEDTNCTLSNLDPDTEYEVRVKAICGVEDESDWVVMTFATLVACPTPSNLVIDNLTTTSARVSWTGYNDSYTVAYRESTSFLNEGFEGGVMPDGWTTEGYDGLWVVGSGDHGSPTMPYSGNYNALGYFEGYDKESYLITPEMNLLGQSGLRLSCYYINKDWEGDNDYFGIYYRVNNGEELGEWQELVATTEEAHEEWTNVDVELIDLNDRYQIGFKVNAKYGHGVGLDNVIVGGSNGAEWNDDNDNVAEKNFTMTGLTANTNYEIKVKSNCGGIYSQVSLFTTQPNNTFTTDGNWNTDSNWSFGEVPTSTDDVVIKTECTIPSTCIAQANTITLDGGGSITIEDGGQLICSNSVAATVKKSIANANGKNPKNHWYTISAPVHTGSNNYVTIGNETTVNLTNNGAYDMFAYQESTHTWLNQKNNGEANGFDKMYAGQGYMYRNSGNELSYVGNTTVGPVNIALSYTSDLDVDDLKGFNLIGNPYTHSIAKGSGKAIDNTKLSTGCYALTNSGIWTIIEDGAEIKPNQGVLVEVSGTVANFQIEDINYVAPTPDPGKYKNDNIKFIVESSEYSDAAYAWFDKGIGLTKINHRNESAPMLYIPQDDNNYAIATMTDDTKVFGLNFKAATAGKYTLSYKATGDYNYLHVIDRLTGEDVDMLLEGEYSFIGTPKDSENRFIVHLEYMPNYGEEGNDIFAYQSGSEILVSGQGELQVFDVTGRRVMTTTINGAESINLSAQGVYILKLNEKVQKIVVR